MKATIRVNKENGRLDYVPVVVLRECDIYGNEMIAMRQRANHYLKSSNKTEVKLAKDLLRCLNWMDREIYALRRQNA